jgi:hypothetical protein
MRYHLSESKDNFNTKFLYSNSDTLQAQSLLKMHLFEIVHFQDFPFAQSTCDLRMFRSRLTCVKQTTLLRRKKNASK